MGINLGRAVTAAAKLRAGHLAGRQVADAREAEEARAAAQTAFEQQKFIQGLLLQKAKMDQEGSQFDQRLGFDRDKLSTDVTQRGLDRGSREKMSGEGLAAALQRAEQDAAVRRELQSSQQSFQAGENAKNRDNAVRIAGMPARSPVGADGTPGKAVPQPVAKAYLANQQQIKTIDRALQEVAKNPKALGLKAFIPDVVLNRVPDRIAEGFEGGIEARAGVADVGSLLIHDRSGATVTVAESPRLKPFVPLPTDDAKTATKKLQRLRQLLVEETDGIAQFYSAEQGYRSMPGAAATPAVRKSPARQKFGLEPKTP